MKAMILAAGAGSRLRPLTDERPKPMIEIGGMPILEHNVRLLERHGVSDIIINLHYRPQAITSHFGDGSDFNVHITYSHEPELLGTAGGVKAVEEFFDDDFFLVYGDNLSTCNLSNLMALHKQQAAVYTMALFFRDDPSSSGIVGTAEDGRITSFLEKPLPDQVFSNWVNAGYFALSPSLLPHIPRGRPFDFGHDLLPQMLRDGARAYGYKMHESLWWIDSIEDYERTVQSFS